MIITFGTCPCVFPTLLYSHAPSVLSAVRVQATCCVSMMTCTVSLSIFWRYTVMTTPISKSRLIRIFLYSVISPCCPLLAISAAGTLPKTVKVEELCILEVTIQIPNRLSQISEVNICTCTFMNLILRVLCTKTTCRIFFLCFSYTVTVVNS